MELPPVIGLMTSECPQAQLSFETVRRKLSDQGFVKDVRNQAEYSLAKYPYVDARGDSSEADFAIFPTGGLSPLSPFGQCQNPRCRLENAVSFARSVGLYADYAVVSDLFTSHFLKLDSVTEHNLMRIYADLVALHALMPMLREGVVRFARPAIRFCEVHLREAEEVTSKVAEHMWLLLQRDAKVKMDVRRGGKNFITVESSFFGSNEEPLSVLFEVSSDVAKALQRRHKLQKGGGLPRASLAELKPLVYDTVKAETRVTFLDASSAARYGSVVASSSRFENIALRILDKAWSQQTPHEDWERVRSIPLPWVSSLSATEVLQLREQAARALPRFRALMNKELFSLSDAPCNPDEYSINVATRLRGEVAELEAELRAAKVTSGHLFRAGLGVSGIGCIVYGIGSRDPLALSGGAAIMSVLAALHPADRTAQAEHERLLSRPAYVLLAARDLIKHRD